MSNELSNNVRPSYLMNDNVEDYSRKSMMSFAQPPRLKIIQAMTGSPFKPPFNDKDIVVIPQMLKVGDEKSPITFVPIYFFSSWVCWNPAQLKNSLPAIRESSYDEKSLVAKKAKSFITEPCPEDTKYELVYSTLLNFIVVLEDHSDLCNTPVVMYFNRGEYKTGQLLIGLLQTRNTKFNFACRFRAASGMHPGKKGTWYGLNIENDPTPWVDEVNFNKYAEMNKTYHELHMSRTLTIDLDDSDLQNSENSSSEF